MSSRLTFLIAYFAVSCFIQTRADTERCEDLSAFCGPSACTSTDDNTRNWTRTYCQKTCGLCGQETANVALNKRIEVSELMFAFEPAERAVDGDDTTCMYANDTQHAWVQVDLGASTNIAGYRIKPREFYSDDISQAAITVSEDGINFEDCKVLETIARNQADFVAATGECTNGPVNARYLRITGQTDMLPLCEVGVYSGSGNTDDAVDDPNANQETANVALTIERVRVSDLESLTDPAELVLDGDDTTCTYVNDTQHAWVQVDLGASANIAGYRIKPDSYYSDDISLAAVTVSEDGINFEDCKILETVARDQADYVATGECTNGPVNARYLRITAQTDYFTLCEVGVYSGSGNTDDAGGDPNANQGSSRDTAMTETMTDGEPMTAYFTQNTDSHIPNGIPQDPAVTSVAECAYLCRAVEFGNCIGFDFNYGRMSGETEVVGPYQGVSCWIHDISSDVSNQVTPAMEVDFFLKKTTFDSFDKR